MYPLSTRTLSALAYERGEEYDPSLPPASPGEIDARTRPGHAPWSEAAAHGWCR